MGNGFIAKEADEKLETFNRSAQKLKPNKEQVQQSMELTSRRNEEHKCENFWSKDQEIEAEVDCSIRAMKDTPDTVGVWPRGVA